MKRSIEVLLLNIIRQLQITNAFLGTALQLEHKLSNDDIEKLLDKLDQEIKQE